MRGRLWIGTSGWVYPHWKDIFYPSSLPTKNWLEYYAERFPTVEINNSFYRMPSERAFESWRTTVPAGFCFAVKGNRFVTHLKKLRGVEEHLQRFLERARLLGDKLGPILFQLPPFWNRNVERLRDFLRILPNDLRFALEFRNQTWLDEEVYAALEKYEVAFCIISLPKFPCPIRATAPFTYFRFHGREVTYASRYQETELRWWAERMGEFLTEGRDVYAYFNNDAFGYAVENAMELRALLE